MKALLSHQGCSIQRLIVAQPVLESTSIDICIFDNKPSGGETPIHTNVPVVDLVRWREHHSTADSIGTSPAPTREDNAIEAAFQLQLARGAAASRR